jgi:hypothetical protein
MSTTEQIPLGIQLPEGYVLYNPDAIAAAGAAVLGAEELYGGSTMNWALDGAGVWYLGCNARKDDIFRFRIFELIEGALHEVALPDVGPGRGWVDVAADGFMYYSSWDGGRFVPASGPAKVPGALPVAIGGGAGGLRYTQAPNEAIRIFKRLPSEPPFSGQAVVQLAPLGVPLAARLSVRLTIAAPTLNAAGGPRGRIGGTTNTSAMLTAEAQAVNRRMYAFADLSPGANNTLTVMADAGPLSEVYADVLGWWA